MDLTDRDVAFLVWLGVVALGGLRFQALRDVARALFDVVRLMKWAIASFAVYIAAVVWVAQRNGVWDTSLLKETAVWFALPGLPLLFRFTKAWEEQPFYLRTLVGTFSLSALIELYVSFGSFALPVELLILPVIVVLVAVSAFATGKPETQSVGRIAGALVAVIGLVFLVGATLDLANGPPMDPVEFVRLVALPIWLTAASLPFVFAVSLVANYIDTFGRVDRETGGDARGRRRAKIALLVSFGTRNRDLHAFTPMDVRELAATNRWREARNFIAYQQAVVRDRQAHADLERKALVRFAGVEGTDWEGRPLDQREFKETKEALNRLHMFHAAQYKSGRYRADLMTIVDDLVAKTFPASEIVMTIGPKARSWFAWRRTVTGWVFGIGAAGAPNDVWTWDQPEAPDGPPGPGTAWTHAEFDATD